LLAKASGRTRILDMTKAKTETIYGVRKRQV
jgi:hypothetical protein